MSVSVALSPTPTRSTNDGAVMRILYPSDGRLWTGLTVHHLCIDHFGGSESKGKNSDVVLLPKGLRSLRNSPGGVARDFTGAVKSEELACFIAGLDNPVR